MIDPVGTRAIIRLTAAAMALGLVVAGCSKDDSSSTASSSSSASATSATSASSSATSAAPTSEADAAPNYEALLLKVEDLPQIGSGPWVADPAKVTETPPPPDISQTYSSGTNAINATILVTDDVATAATALTGSASSVPSQVTGTPVPVPSVTPDATLTIGTSPDGKSAMAALLFTVENTVAIIVFGSAPGDLNPVPQDFAEAVGQAQVKAIEAGLPELG